MVFVMVTRVVYCEVSAKFCVVSYLDQINICFKF
jgi:hypothetical protein